MNGPGHTLPCVNADANERGIEMAEIAETAPLKTEVADGMRIE